MKEFKYTITDELGLHARPASNLAKEVQKYKSVIMLSNGTKEVKAKSVMSIMSLAVKKGAEVTLTFDGEDEDAAAEAIEKFFKENL